jgi:hypothetical protein
MLNRLFSRLIILAIASIPLAVSIVNYKTQWTGGNKEYIRFMITDICPQITFLAITICLVSLSDYWDSKSDQKSERHVELIQLNFMRSACVFLFITLLTLSFLIYYSEVIFSNRVATVLSQCEFNPTTECKQSESELWLGFRSTTNKFLFMNIVMLGTVCLLYVSNSLIESEFKIIGRLFGKVNP